MKYEIPMALLKYRSVEEIASLVAVGSVANFCTDTYIVIKSEETLMISLLV